METFKKSKTLLSTYIVGSLFILLFCLIAVAGLFSFIYLNNEQQRAEIYQQQLAQFFTYEYQNLTEHMAFNRVEDVTSRISTISGILGDIPFEAFVADVNGNCIASLVNNNFNANCQMPTEFALTEQGASLPLDHLYFDQNRNQYVYETPLYLFLNLEGYIYVAIDDPYSFYRGNLILLMLKVFAPIGLIIIIIWMLWGLFARQFFLTPYLNSLVELKKDQALANLSSQVAHDIRSPLTALEVAIPYLAKLPEEPRLMIRNALERIKDIANNLLSQHKIDTLVEQQQAKQLRTELLAPSIDEIISEKRLLLQNKGITIRAEIQQEAYTAFANLQLTEFKCILSNLINNATEAIVNKTGVIIIHLNSLANKINLTIEDNGKGIPADILSTLFQRKQSFDKATGSGLGLFHAKQCIDAWQGQITLTSQLDEGSKISITLPKAKQPNWFTSIVTIRPNTSVVILDDDKSIHQVWENKIKTSLPSQNDISIVHLFNINEFYAWHKQYANASITYLIDYEIIPNKTTGLDIIKEFNLTKQATLVTSRFEESAIREQCQQLNIQIIPKNIAAYTTIKLLQPQVDLILIDDDQIITDSWQFRAKRKNKQITVFNEINAFLNVADSYDKQIPLYIDSELKAEKKGEEYAKILHDMGFGEIYLATGHDASYFKKMPWIKKIVNKLPPF